MPRRASSLATLTLQASKQAERSEALDHCCPGAAGLQRLARLSQLTHLDLGHSDGMAAATLALAPQLPALQSLALCLTYPLYRASKAVILHTSLAE